MPSAILVALLLMTAPGSSEPFQGKPARPFRGEKVIVDDVSVPADRQSGYRIVEIDGEPPVRASSRLMTVVPLVLLDAGEHTLTLQSDTGKDLPVLKLTARFDARKRYRLERQGSVVSIVKSEK